MIGLVIFLAVILVLLLYFTKIYNNLVSLRENVKKAWSNIDVLLKQRHDELPKLVETCKQYMQFEQETLERVMQARSAVAAAREQGDVAPGSAPPKEPCAWAWASCSRSSKTTRN